MMLLSQAWQDKCQLHLSEGMSYLCDNLFNYWEGGGDSLCVAIIHKDIFLLKQETFQELAILAIVSRKQYTIQVHGLEDDTVQGFFHTA